MASQYIAPVIKWCGGKRKSAPAIATYFPKDFSTYFEPFVGGGALLRHRREKTAVCSDICEPLIALWEEVKNDPIGLSLAYEERWNAFNVKGHEEYYRIRKRFNGEKSPADFLFLSRTCINGLIRFNGNGEFNSPVHLTRPGMRPESLRKILLDWSENIQNVRFVCSDYEDMTDLMERDSLVYLDPPYYHSSTWYYGKFDHERLFAWLARLNEKGVRWLLSYDGQSAAREYAVPFPERLFTRKVSVDAGISGFRGVMKGFKDKVIESLYMNF